MDRAGPAILLSAAGLTWLLHAQGVIDGGSSAAVATTTPSTGGGQAAPPSTTTTQPSFGPDDGFDGGPDGGFDGGPGGGFDDGDGGGATTTTTPSTAAGDKVDGPVEQTRWGPVQVQVVVDNGKLTDVVVLEYPNERQRSVEINNQALPILHDEAISAQSASIDAVSGATTTSQGYLASLQAALDQAGVGN